MLSEKCYDYCLYPYDPLNNNAFKLKSVDILKFISYHQWDSGIINKIIKTLQSEIWNNKTVWWIKNVSWNIDYELYFYLYDDYSLTYINKILDALSKIFTINFRLDKDYDVFMFSVDINKDAIHTKNIPWINIYNKISESFFYDWNLITLKNKYFFYSTKRQYREFLYDLNRIVWIANIDSVLSKRLMDCSRLCIWVKESKIWLYYSRIKYEDFLYFIKTYFYMNNFISFLKTNQNKLDYLYFDVSYDVIPDDFWKSPNKSWFYWYF